MIGRVIWISLMLATAAVTSYAQLDRQARYSPALAGNVPEPFRAFAQTHVTIAALKQDNSDAALAEAKRLVERRPIPAEHLSLLALAHFQAGNPNQASVAIQLAAKRGWRDIKAQEAMLRLAVAAGDGAEAARRYAAILQNKAGDTELLAELAPQVFETETNGKAARDTLAATLAGGARWHGRFLDRGAQVIPAKAYVEIVRTASAQGASFDCPRLQSAAKNLGLRNGEAAASLAAIATDLC